MLSQRIDSTGKKSHRHVSAELSELTLRALKRNQSICLPRTSKFHRRYETLPRAPFLPGSGVRRRRESSGYSSGLRAYANQSERKTNIVAPDYWVAPIKNIGLKCIDNSIRAGGGKRNDICITEGEALCIQYDYKPMGGRSLAVWHQGQQASSVRSKGRRRLGVLQRCDASLYRRGTRIRSQPVFPGAALHDAV